MKLLLAIDHTSASQKAVAFVGSVWAGSPPKDLSIGLFHVLESLPEFLSERAMRDKAGGAFQHVADEWITSAQAKGEQLLAAARETLVNAGIPPGSISVKLIRKDSLPESKKVVAALALIDEIKQGDYDVICVGRRGSADALGSFIGSVAEKVLRAAAGKTVWVVD